MKFSNQNIFKLYLLIRGIIVIFVFIGIFSVVTKTDGFIFESITSLAIISLLILLSLESYINLNYLEISYDTKLKNTFICLFNPDRRFFIYFKESKINRQQIPKSGILDYKLRKKSFLSKLLILKLINEGQTYKIGKFNIFWATNRDISKLIEIIESHNSETKTTANNA